MNAPTLQPNPRRRLVAAMLVVLMVFGCLALWLGIPIFWLWVASQLVSDASPTFGPYALVAFAIPISMVLMAMALRYVDHIHSRLINRPAPARVQAPWMKSMRGERETKRNTTVLDVVMLSTAACAVAAMGIWFLVAAGNPLPH